MKTLEITVTQEQLAVMKKPPLCLAAILTYREREFAVGGPTGWTQSSQLVRSWDCDRLGQVAFPAGLLPRVAAACRAEGYQVEVEDQRVPPDVTYIDSTVFAAANEQELASLQAIIDNPMGQLEVPSPKHVIDRCVLVARAFPLAKTVMAVPTKRLAWRLWWQLQRALGEHVGLAVAGVDRPGERCRVGTFVAVSDSKNCDILLLPYGDESTGSMPAQVTCKLQWRHVRTYAIVVANRHRHEQQQLRLESMAGPLIAEVKKPRSTIEVACAPVNASPCIVRAGPTILERKRHLYWGNTERNKRIAEVCLAAAAGDADALCKLGLDRFDFANWLGDRLPCVTVLVESVAHAKELAPLLPGWKACQGAPIASKAKCDKEKIEDVRPVKKPAKKNRIMAAVYAATHSIHTDVLVRASGGIGLPRVKGLARVAEYGSRAAPVLLIDFMDAYERGAAKDSKRRVREYQAAGMDLLRSARKMIQ